MVTQERLKELFEYADGRLIRKVQAGSNGNVGDAAGARNKDGRWYVGVDNSKLLLHRAIFLCHHGFCPPLVDHRDQDPNNNRIENLRELDKSGNTVNCDKIRGAVPYRGVWFNKLRQKYVANIKKDYKKYSLGYYFTAEEASAAYEKARKELFPNVFNDDT